MVTPDSFGSRNAKPTVPQTGYPIKWVAYCRTSSIFVEEAGVRILLDAGPAPVVNSRECHTSFAQLDDIYGCSSH